MSQTPTADEEQRFERALDILAALQMEASSRARSATDPAEIEAWRQHDTRLHQERKALRAHDSAGVERILTDYPEVLRSWRAGG